MNLRNLFLALVITFLSFPIFSQNSNEFRIYYGFSDSHLLREDLSGAAGYENENSYEFGARYLRQISGNFAIETGVNYFKTDVKITPPFMGNPVESRYEQLELISIPVLLNYTLWDYFFVNAGPLLDFQQSDNTNDPQSGFGYSLGLGAKYYFNNFLLFVNPNFKRHAVIPFEKENYHQKLTEFGLQLGIGYSF